MSILEIKLPHGLPSKRGWTHDDCAAAYVSIMPWLIAPSNEEYRDEVRAALNLELMLQLNERRRYRSKSGIQLLSGVRARFRKDRRELIWVRSAQSYAAHLSEGRGGRAHCRRIVATGLLVKRLTSPAWPADTPRSVKIARGLVLADIHDGRFARKVLPKTSDTSLRSAWDIFAPVAHLCASIVDLLDAEAAEILDEPTLSQLKAQMAAFTTTASEYQQQLTVGERSPGGWRRTVEGAPPLAMLPSLSLAAAPRSQRGQLQLTHREPEALGQVASGTADVSA